MAPGILEKRMQDLRSMDTSEQADSKASEHCTAHEPKDEIR